LRVGFVPVDPSVFSKPRFFEKVKILRGGGNCFFSFQFSLFADGSGLASV
jgi:hypothetical protein